MAYPDEQQRQRPQGQQTEQPAQPQQPGQPRPAQQYPQQPGPGQPQQPNPAQQQRPAQQYPQQPARPAQQYPQQPARPAQQYPQQAQQQTQPTQPLPETPHKEPKLGKSLIVIGALIMVAGIAMFIFAITGENEIDMSPSKSPTGLSIESIVFASVVNEDLTFEAKPDKHFLSIQPVYILIKPKGYASSVSGSKYSLDIVEGLFVRDPNGRLLDYLSKKNLLTIKESDAKDIAIKNMLKFNDDAESGEYEITVDLIDRRTGQSTTMTETMTIEKAVFG